MSYFDRTRKANPYHDSKGRFASANSGKSFSAGDYNDQYDDATVTDKSVFNKFSEEDKFRIKEIDKKVKTKPMTHTDAANYTGTFPDGEWSEARKAVHDKIISKILNEEAIKNATPKNGEKPDGVILGGRGGSGKSAFINGTLNEFDAKKYIELDSDIIKAQLPGFDGFNAALHHEESSYIYKEISNIVHAKGLNVVHNITLKSESSGITVMETMKKSGYTTQAHYMYLPRQEAATRAVYRALGKEHRFVPPSVVLANTNNEKNFDKLKSSVDKWSFYDNQVPRGKPPKRIAGSN